MGGTPAAVGGEQFRAVRSERKWAPSCVLAWRAPGPTWSATVPYELFEGGDRGLWSAKNGRSNDASLDGGESLMIGS